MLLNETNAALRILDARIIGADGSGLSLSHTWVTGTVKISKNGGAFANTAALPTAVTGGITGTFRLQLSAGEVDTLGSLRVQFTPAGAYAVEYTDTVVDSSGSSAPSAATVADAVWDEARAGHVTAGSFGEGVNVQAIAAAAANTVRDSLLNFTLRTGRTVRGHLRRMDGLFFNRVTGLLGALVTIYQPDGVTVEATVPQDTALGNRTAGTVTNSETP